ncbi:MAG: AI-2E family transporter [Bacteroidota bacterium]
MSNKKKYGFQKEPSSPSWLKTPLILLGLCLLVVILIYGRFILMPLAFAALFSMLLSPVIKQLELWRVGRVTSIILALSVITVILAGLITLISVQLIQFSNSLPDITNNVKSTSYDGIYYIEGITGVSEERLTEYMKNGVKSLFETGGELMSSLAEATKGTLIFLSLLPIFIFFMLYYKSMYHMFLEKIFIKSHNSDIDLVIKRVQRVTQNYLIGVFTVIGIMAVLNTIGLLIIGLDYAIFFAVFASFLAIIPYIGSLLGALPAVLYATLTGNSFWLPLFVIVVFVRVQLFEGNFMTSKIIGPKVSINPFDAVIALLIGGEIWGIAGMILFIPMIGILRVGFAQVRELEPYGYLLGNIIDYEESLRDQV